MITGFKVELTSPPHQIREPVQPKIFGTGMSLAFPRGGGAPKQGGSGEGRSSPRSCEETETCEDL